MIKEGAFIMAYWYRPLLKKTADMMFVDDAASVQDTTTFLSQIGVESRTLSPEGSLEAASASVQKLAGP